MLYTMALVVYIPFNFFSDQLLFPLHTGRHQLRKIVGSEISGKDTSNYNDETNAGLEIAEYLERRDEDEKRFERDLSVMIGCVSPRSLSARFKITCEIS